MSLTTTQKQTRVIVESIDGSHWSAWFEQSPWEAFGGDWPTVAVLRLLGAHGIEHGESIVADDERCRAGHLEFVIADASETCRECGGSGKYTGLDVVEPCRACGGSGRVGVETVTS